MKDRRVLVLVSLVVAVLIAGIAIAVTAGGGSTHHNSQQTSIAAANAVATDYYLALQHNQVRRAYGLLCTAQQLGFRVYSAEASEAKDTDNGVASFRRTAGSKIKGDQAAVPADIVLASGEKTPIIVLLVSQQGRWRVCSSDLGGVLPPPGNGSSPTSTPAPIT